MKLKFITALFFLGGLLSSALAQNNTETEWSLHKEHPKLRVESKLTTCNIEDGIQTSIYLMKFTNKSSSPIKVTYFREYYYEGEGCVTCPNNEYKSTLTIPAGATVVGSCDNENSQNQHLTMFKEYSNNPRLNGSRKFEKFDIRLISVE